MHGQEIAYIVYFVSLSHEYPFCALKCYSILRCTTQYKIYLDELNPHLISHKGLAHDPKTFKPAITSLRATMRIAPAASGAILGQVVVGIALPTYGATMAFHGNS